jgi:hypothetical protein
MRALFLREECAHRFFFAVRIQEETRMKLWHFAVLVITVTVLLWAQNNIAFYGKLTQ